MSQTDYAARPLLWRLWRLYRLRMWRRYLLYRAVRARHDLTCAQNRTDAIHPSAILCFATIRNEAERLPFFLDHHRQLGVDRFLIVDNDSSDGTSALLADQADVSVWHTNASYRAARFGISWLTWLQIRYGAGHWCLTLDADETLIYPHHDTQPLPALTAELDRRGARSFRTLMLELYPKGPIADHSYAPGQNPTETLPYFDKDGFWRYIHPEFLALVERGGARARLMFADQPRKAPTMHKTPLIRWSRRYAYSSSTHTVLPRGLNVNYGTDAITGALLHSKLLPQIVAKSADPHHRSQHFAEPDTRTAYHDALAASPDFWHPEAETFEDWRQLQRLGLISDGGWHP